MQRVLAARLPPSGPPEGRLSGMYRELLDDWIGEQVGCQFRDPLLRNRLAQFDLEPLTLPDSRDLAEAEASARTSNGIALGIVDLGLQHHVNDNSGHQGSVRHGSRRYLRCMSCPWRVLSQRKRQDGRLAA